MALNLAGLGIDDQVLEAGGLDQNLHIFRLPENRLSNTLSFSRNVKLEESGDTTIWISLKTEDGFQAWSTPIYLHH